MRSARKRSRSSSAVSTEPGRPTGRAAGRAKAAIGNAREMFVSGNHEAALKQLAEFAPPHDLVVGALQELRQQFEELHRQRHERRARQTIDDARKVFAAGTTTSGGGRARSVRSAAPARYADSARCVSRLLPSSAPARRTNNASRSAANGNSKPSVGWSRSVGSARNPIGWHSYLPRRQTSSDDSSRATDGGGRCDRDARTRNRSVVRRHWDGSPDPRRM